MTKKESYLYELLCAKNLVKELKNEPKLDVEEYSKTYAFVSKAKSYKLYELENEMESVTKQIEMLKKEKAREAWFETEAGKAFKAEKEALRKSIGEQIIELRESAFQHTRKVVKSLLGEAWDVITFDGRSMEIGLAESYREDGTAKGLFGHEFNVYFDKALSFGKENTQAVYEWKINYGTMGSFDIGDEQRTAYLVGLAMFASDNITVPALREYLHGFVKSIEALQDAGWKIKKELDNPPMEAA